MPQSVATLQTRKARSSSTMFFSSKILGLFCCFLQLAACQNVVRIETKTGDQVDAGMLHGTIDIEIKTIDSTSCVIEELESNTFGGFEQGFINFFMGSELKGCENFFVPEGNVTSLVLSHK